MSLDILQEKFENAFDANDGTRFFHAPGRVNLIGEHTDYNGGYVFPCALSLGTYGVIRRHDQDVVRFASGNDPRTVEAPLSCIAYDPSHGWANYPKAVLAEMLAMGHSVGGFDLYVSGDVPNGAGLSSSASLDMCAAIALNSLFGCKMDNVALALLCQRAENNFIGVNCGIMDPFASAMGKRGHAILLQCQKLIHSYVPLNMDGYRIVIANTNKKRGLSSSKYNERRAQCEAALSELKKGYGRATCLCDFTVETFEQHKHTIKDETVARRAQHTVYENARTLSAVEALNGGDLAEFGRLMNDSHASLKDLYEVTGPELDALAEAAWEVDGVLGSRMTGAGFGGCTVSIVYEGAVSAFQESVGASYSAKTGLAASFYVAETGDGAREIYA